MDGVHSSEAAVLDLPFDQYQRYRLVADLVRSLGTERLKILDVGGRTALLRRFLPEHDVTLVDVRPSDEAGLVLGDGSALPFADGSFDLVCGFDTLEHVPEDRRASFVDECTRVATRWIALSGPYADPDVEEAEALVRGVLSGMGVRNVHLEEHARHGLPDRQRTEARLRESGAELATFAHGNLSLWLPAISIGFYMDVEPTLRDAARDVHRFINRELYASDHGGHPYRHVVFAARAGAPLPAETGLAAPARSGVSPTRRLIEHVATLGLVERSRATWSAEREQWQRDLELWRSERDELAVENDELRADLDGHRSSLTVVSSDLEAHRRELASARRERDEALVVTERVLRELAEFRSVRDEERTTLESELAGQRAHARTLEDDLREHRKVVATLSQDLEGRQAHARALEDDLQGHRDLVAALTEELGRHRAQAHALGARVADLQEQLDAVHRERAEAQTDRRRLTREVALMQQRIEDYDSIVESLERSLRSRSQNLRRALSLRPLVTRPGAVPEGQEALEAPETETPETPETWRARRA